MSVHAYGTQTSLIVDRVLPRRGVAGYWLGPEQEANNVLVSRGTFDFIRSTAGEVGPPTWLVVVSNRGGVEPGAARTDAATRQVRRIAAAAGVDAEVYPAKQRRLETADDVGEGFSSMFTAMGSFGVLAGLLLLVNLFVMLAAERKTELGMARAVGMRRSELVGAFATEGWLYAVVATALGVLVGIGLGAILVAVSARIFASEHNRFDLYFTLEPRSLARAFAIGFVVALATIVGTSLRVSRLNIIRAIRDLPEPPPRGRRLRVLVGGGIVAAAGVALTLQGVSSREGFALLLGPTLAVAGLTPFATRLGKAHAVQSVAAFLIVIWGAALFALIPSVTKSASIILFVVQGIVLTAAAVTLVSLQQDRLSRMLRRATGGRSLSVRLGLAYPLARRSRTGLTIAMYALVVFILTFITSLAHMINGEVETATTRVRGGYDVIVSSSSANPVGVEQLSGIDGVLRVAPLARTSGLFRAGDMKEDVLWNVTAFDGRFVRGGAPQLEDRGSYPSDAAAWEAVLHDPNLAIVDPVFLQEGGGPAEFVAEPGTKIRVKDPYTGRVRALTVAALAASDYYIANGVFMGLPGASKFFGYPLSLDRLYVALAPRHRPGRVRRRRRGDVPPQRHRGRRDRDDHGRGVHHDEPDLPALPGLPGDGPDRGDRRDRGRRHPRRPRAAPPDRDAARDRLPRPPGRPDVRSRDRLRGRRGDGDRRRARARHPLRHRRAERLLGRRPLLGPVPEPRRPAPGHRRGVAARDGLAGDLGEPHPARRRTADDGLNASDPRGGGRGRVRARR